MQKQTKGATMGNSDLLGPPKKIKIDCDGVEVLYVRADKIPQIDQEKAPLAILMNNDRGLCIVGHADMSGDGPDDMIGRCQKPSLETGGRRRCLVEASATGRCVIRRRGMFNGDGNGSGYGEGDGNGYGDGYGIGYGSGYSDGDGYGDGYGDGDGDGIGCGSGYGEGDGNGYGDGYGDGDGSGSGYGDGT
jgi:hypothetical protein